MAAKSLAQKLYIRPGQVVMLLNPPKGGADLLAPLPDGVKIVSNPKGALKHGEADVVVSFVKSVSDINKSVEQLRDGLSQDSILWFAYPKQKGKSAGEINRDQGWKVLYDLGYRGIASVAIDDTWSGLRFRPGLPSSDHELVAKQYAGQRAALMPIYNHLVNVATSFGHDVELVVRQSYVAFARGKQFALVRPTNTRIDLALRLPSAPLRRRIAPAAGVGSGSMTHRVEIKSVDDIDREVIAWMQEAYRAAGKEPAP